MSSTRYALFALRLVLLLMWSVTGAAAALTVAQAPILAPGVDPWVMLWAASISTLAGGTTLAIRVNNLLMQQEADGKPGIFKRPVLFAIAHMGGSWLAGSAGFMAGSAANAPVMYLLFGVLLASFGGAAWLEKLVDKYVPVMPVSPGTAKDSP